MLSDGNMMVRNLKLNVATSADHWQSRCLDFAKSRETFVLKGVEAEHREFCDAFCQAFNYQCRYSSTDFTATLAPKKAG